MRVRSPRWRTVHLLSADFDRLAGAFAPSNLDPDPSLVPVFDPFNTDNRTLGEVFA